MTEINREALFFAKTLAVSVTPVPPPGTHPDRDLLAACAALDAAEREHHTFFYGPDRIDDDDARDVALEPVTLRDAAVLALCVAEHIGTLTGLDVRPDISQAMQARIEYANSSILLALMKAGIRMDDIGPYDAEYEVSRHRREEARCV